MINKCFYCDNNRGPESLEILHKGEIVGFICDVCLQDPKTKGLKILMKKNEKNLFMLEQVIPLENPI